MNLDRIMNSTSIDDPILLQSDFQQYEGVSFIFLCIYSAGFITLELFPTSMHLCRYSLHDDCPYPLSSSFWQICSTSYKTFSPDQVPPQKDDLAFPWPAQYSYFLSCSLPLPGVQESVQQSRIQIIPSYEENFICYYVHPLLVWITLILSGQRLERIRLHLYLSHQMVWPNEPFPTDSYQECCSLVC